MSEAIAGNDAAEGACPLHIDIGGMHCAACSSRIERVVGRMDGVEKISVNLATAKAEVWASPGREVEVQHEIMERVATLGFSATPAADDDAYLNSRSDNGFDLLRIAVEHVGRKTVFLSPLQGFTAEFQEYSVVFHKRSGI